MKNFSLTLVLLFCLPLAQAASLNIAVAESPNGSEGSSAINLTAEGTMDWAIWQNTGRTPTNTMNGGNGFTSLTKLASAGDTGATFGHPENAYSWTNGEPTSTGNSVTEAARIDIGNNGDGIRLALSIPSAGTYQLKFYTTTYNTNINGTARLLTGGVTQTAVGNSPSGLINFEYTVDFTTDAADTLQLDLVRSGGSASTLAFEAFTLSSASADPNLVVAPETSYQNEHKQQVFHLPISNSSSANPLNISSVVITGADAAAFTIDSTSSPLAAGATGNIDFTFTPTAGNREYHAVFTIHSNDPDSPTTTAEVTVVSSSINLGKIICVGDSITEGNADRPAGDGNWSWRYGFWKHLVDSTVLYEFVGTRTSNKNGASVYPEYQGKSFPNRHEAIWGTTALERGNSASTYLATLKSQGKTPDTAIVYLGGNDIPLNLSVSAATVRNRIKVIIDKLQGDTESNGNPNIRILLVSVIPRFTGSNLDTPDVRNATRFTEINNLLDPLAKAETTATSKVTYLNIFPLFENPPGELWDGTHPNAAGEPLEYNAIFRALVPDSDDDGMTDAWEEAHFPNIAAAMPNDDADLDGIRNIDEFNLGRDPNQSNSSQFISFSNDSSQLSFTLPAATGPGYEGLMRRFILQSSLDLQNWGTSEIEGVADGNPVTFSIPNIPRKFYRLEVDLVSSY